VRVLRVATRASPLARAQTAIVGELLGVAIEEVVIETSGDRQLDTPIWDIGGQGVFVKEVQAAVLNGRADAAVHSAKDLPAASTPGLVIAAVPQRQDPRDALVGRRFDDLPVGARIGTGSVRRRAQLAWLRPDLSFGSLRGNIDTRLSRAGDYHAIVVAVAALNRLGRRPLIVQVLEPDLVLPQVGQGALAVECREDDSTTRAVLSAADHGNSRKALETERAWLATVGGGCDFPVGAFATVDTDGDASDPATATIHLDAVMATCDGRVLIRHHDKGHDPVALGQRVARHLLDNGGASLSLAGMVGA